MRTIAGKPYKVTLKGRDGKPSRTRWQVKLYSRDAVTDKLTPVAQKTFKSKGAAVDAIPKLQRSYDKTNGGIKTGAKMTFSDLVDKAEQSIYAPATIHRDRKVAGIRSTKTKQSQLKTLKDYFGTKRITNIRYSDLLKFKTDRLENGSRQQGDSAGSEISISTLNRDLSAIRRLLKFAVDEEYIEKSPFKSDLIDNDAEVARERIVSDAEESILLPLCEPGVKQVPTKRKRKDGTTITIPIQTGNPELKAIVLLALDSGLRQNEILTLSWDDIDFAACLATVQAKHTKTLKERKVYLTDRTLAELKALPSCWVGRPNLFDTGTIKRSWSTVRRLAGIEDVHFHDLRSTCATRLTKLDVPQVFIKKILGHETKDVTQKHYQAVETSLLDDIRRRMNQYIVDRRSVFSMPPNPGAAPTQELGEVAN